MSRLSYRILPNPDDKTHEVRLIVDGADWIGEDRLGLDPPDLIFELRRTDRDRIIVGRCTCGVIGCDDLVVKVVRTAETVEWSRPDGPAVAFDADQFDDVVGTLARDYSWEPLGRTVERELGVMFSGKVTDDGYAFDWSSTRFRPGVVVLSVTKDGQQKLLEFSWDEATLDSALKRGRQVLRERFED
jgi:hypothetical protein